MGKIWMPGGGGGADLDVITAGAGDVLSGKVIVDKDGEPLTGALALSGNASDAQVLSGQTYYNSDPKTKRTGTMPNRGAVNQALGINGAYTIPEGYHNGSGKVTQSIPTLGGQTITPGTSQQTVSSSGKYMTGNVVVNGDADLVAGNILNGVNIFGVTGNVRKYAWLSTQKSTVGSKSFTNTDGNVYTLPYLSFAPGFTPIMYTVIIYNSYITSVSTPWNTVFVGAGINDNRGFYSRSSAPATASSLVIPVLNSGTYNVWIAGYY